LYLLNCLYNGRMSMRGKQNTKIRRSGKIATIRAPAAGAKRPRNWSEELGEMFRPIKKPVTLRLDADVIAWFKAKGRGYQTRINRGLRELMQAGKGG
jgi:uncharacterized protein (DUF4415 family)